MQVIKLVKGQKDVQIYASDMQNIKINANEGSKCKYLENSMLMRKIGWECVDTVINNNRHQVLSDKVEDLITSKGERKFWLMLWWHQCN